MLNYLKCLITKFLSLRNEGMIFIEKDSQAFKSDNFKSES